MSKFKGESFWFWDYSAAIRSILDIFSVLESWKHGLSRSVNSLMIYLGNKKLQIKNAGQGFKWCGFGATFRFHGFSLRARCHGVDTRYRYGKCTEKRPVAWTLSDAKELWNGRVHHSMCSSSTRCQSIQTIDLEDWSTDSTCFSSASSIPPWVSWDSHRGQAYRNAKLKIPNCDPKTACLVWWRETDLCER